MSKPHPCLSCGACCAVFRVSFHWSETLPESHQVPLDMIETISPHLYAMKGTHQPSPHCDALIGEVGSSVSCKIYDRRSSTCREFKASFEDGTRNEVCDQARAAKGLPALSLQSFAQVCTVYGKRIFKA